MGGIESMDLSGDGFRPPKETLFQGGNANETLGLEAE